MSEENPLFSFALVAYNQEGYIEDAVNAALAQDYSPLQVILSDDCSTDKTFEIIEAIAGEYEGAHEILLNRNSENLGIGGHVNKVLGLCRGDWIVMAAGDDVSDKSRTSRIGSHISQALCDIDCVSVQLQEINQEGIETGRILNRHEGGKDFKFNQLAGAGLAYSRRVRDLFPPISDKVHNEDVVLYSRAMLLSRISFINEDLVKYRRHKGNIKTSFRSLNEQWLNDKRLSADRLGYAIDQIELDMKNYPSSKLGYWGSMLREKESFDLALQIIDKKFFFLSRRSLIKVFSNRTVIKVLIGSLVIRVKMFFI